MKKFINEFKEFALKGNMFDMAIGVIMGSAVSKVVSSVVNDLITPLISTITGNGSAIAERVWIVNEVEIRYGLFINNLFDFLLTAFIIFLMVKMMNKLRNLHLPLMNKPKEEKKEEKKEISQTDQLLTEILEELKKKK